VPSHQCHSTTKIQLQQWEENVQKNLKKISNKEEN